jgi:hypothetical protein
MQGMPGHVYPQGKIFGHIGDLLDRRVRLHDVTLRLFPMRLSVLPAEFGAQREYEGTACVAGILLQFFTYP